MNTLRHGDWTFHPTNEKVTGEKVKLTTNEYTFAEGEATGHFHTLHADRLEDMDFYRQSDGSYMVVLKKDGYATHPEHSMKTDLVIPAGTYHLKQRREKDWFSLTVRKVID
jgi:hypothetical protein